MCGLPKRRAVFSAAAGLAVVCLAWAADPPPKPSRGVELAQLKPQWRLGDEWVVETASLPLQVRDKLPARSRARPIQWQFAVQTYEKVLQDDCYKVEVRCLLEGPPQPMTTLWVDRKSHVLRQVDTQIPVPGGFRTMSESYDFPSGQPSPVVGLLSALPLDFPLFHGGELKGTEKFNYVASAGRAETKALGDVDFSCDVEQEADTRPPEEVKDLLAADFSKDLAARPAVEIRLKGTTRQVRQVWRAGLPWPAYSDDGCTVSRLVKVKPAAERARD